VVPRNQRGEAPRHRDTDTAHRGLAVAAGEDPPPCQCCRCSGKVPPPLAESGLPTRVLVHESRLTLPYETYTAAEGGLRGNLVKRLSQREGGRVLISVPPNPRFHQHVPRL